MHRRTDLYGPDASEFRPERWGEERLARRGGAGAGGFQYLPFNAGPRICIGQQFAQTQLALVTFRLLQAFETVRCAGEGEEDGKNPRPIVQKLGVNTSMLHGCWVSMTPAKEDR